MTSVLWGIGIVSLVVALLAVRRAYKLQHDVNQLKRDHYYARSEREQIAKEIRESVQPLRLHLAKVASGGSVPQEMILNGRLYQDITAEDAQRVYEREAAQGEGRVLVVDVRTPKEYAVRHLPGAKLVPFDELEVKYQEEIPLATEKVLVYCMEGERSRLACEFLSLRGYTNLYNLRDGLRAWQGPTEGEDRGALIQIHRKDATPVH